MPFLGLTLPLGLALVAGAPRALGQTALGNGQGLYRDLQQRNSLASSGRDYVGEARNRNAIAFGRAPGGLSFRGGLGYKDPNEFMGSLGSTSLNSFISGSKYSAQVSQGIRGQQALQQQRALSIGAPRPSGLRGSLETPRGATSSGADFTPAYQLSQSGGLRVDPLGDRRDQARRPGNALSSRLPSTGAGAPVRGGALGSAAFGGSGGQQSDYESGNERLGLSGRLSGRVNEMDSPDAGYGLDNDIGGSRSLAVSDRNRRGQEQLAADTERARARAGGAAARPTEVASNRVPGGEDRRAQTQPPRIRTMYDDLIDRLDKRMGPAGAPPTPGTPGAPADSQLAAGARPDWQQRMDKLKGAMDLDPQRRAGRITLFGEDRRRSALATARSEKKDDPSKRPTPFDPTGREKIEKDKETPDKPRDTRFDPQTLQMIREAAVKVDNLAPIGAVRGRDFFAEHMKVGQVLLEQGKYFDAEERFTRALSAKSGDVTAEVGRIHSQIGAGLYLSAGQNLRRLLAGHPEAAGLRYSAKLVPSGARGAAVVEQLRENLSGEGRLRRESALLLAYMGFQLQEIETARAGIDAVAATAQADPEVRTAGDERLADLLRGIWLDPSLYGSKDAPENK